MGQKFDDIINRTERILGYRFKNESLLERSLTHSSVANGSLASNERMEFLGDAVLGFVICEHLFNKFPDEREGELTKIKSAVVSRRICAQISDKLDLTSLLNLGKGMNGQMELPSSVSAAAYESIIAAIYLDGGLPPAREFILTSMKEMIDEAAESTHQENFKSVLQQHAQQDISELPNYLLLDEKGPDHSKCFEVCVEIHGTRYPSAWGQSKKQAEQQAALLALEVMEVVNIDKDGRVHLCEDNSAT